MKYTCVIKSIVSWDLDIDWDNARDEITQEFDSYAEAETYAEEYLEFKETESMGGIPIYYEYFIYEPNYNGTV